MITRQVKTVPKLVLNDGTTMSVQASSFHYCNPRNDYGPYHEVEVGYVEDKDGNAVVFETPNYKCSGRWSDVYSFIDTHVLMDFIEIHGGIHSGGLPSLSFLPRRTS